MEEERAGGQAWLPWAGGLRAEAPRVKLDLVQKPQGADSSQQEGPCPTEAQSGSGGGGSVCSGVAGQGALGAEPRDGRVARWPLRSLPRCFLNSPL